MSQQYLKENASTILKGSLYALAYASGGAVMLASAPVSLLGASVFATAASVSGVAGLGLSTFAASKMTQAHQTVYENNVAEIQNFGADEDKQTLEQAQNTLKNNDQKLKKFKMMGYAAGVVAGVGLAYVSTLGIAALGSVVAVTAYNFAVRNTSKKELTQQSDDAKNDVKDLAIAIRKRRGGPLIPEAQKFDI